ncbi:hypothetical protein HD554DRAFT_2139933 [Boletus coccyginus]|nr:hypothetical protein HD554DRAFT_2139933 [Boletus coccyginus]
MTRVNPTHISCLHHSIFVAALLQRLVKAAISSTTAQFISTLSPTASQSCQKSALWCTFAFLVSNQGIRALVRILRQGSSIDRHRSSFYSHTTIRTFPRASAFTFTVTRPRPKDTHRNVTNNIASTS